MKRLAILALLCLHTSGDCCAQWSPSRMGAPRRWLAAAATETHVYFAGGRNSLTPSTDLVDVFESATGVYSTLQLPVRRYDLSGVGYEGRAFFAGGRLPITDTPSDQLDVWNEATGQWAQYNMPFPIWGAAIEAIDDKVFVAGALGTPSAVVQVFDIASETFSTEILLGPPRFLQRSGSDGRWICFFGGAGPNVGYEVDIYDSLTGTWSQVRTSVLGGRGAVVEGNLYLAGRDTNTTFNRLHILDIATQTWSSVRLRRWTVQPFVGACGPFLVLANGRGRTSAAQYLLDSSILYDTWSGEWSELPMNSSAGERVTAAQRETGRFYVAGGSLDNSPSTTVDTIDVLELEIDMGQSYCPQSTPNSTGQVADLRLAGSASVSANVVALAMHQVPSGAFGFFLVGTAPATIVNPGSLPGTLCVGGSFGRLFRQVRAADERGILGIRLDLQELPLGPVLRPAQPGETLYVQGWYRDVTPGTGAPTARLSDARAFTVTN